MPVSAFRQPLYDLISEILTLSDVHGHGIWVLHSAFSTSTLLSSALLTAC